MTSAALRSATFGGAAVGLLADRMLGEPPDWWHPVARFGQSMLALEDQMYADSRASGIAFSLVGIGGAGVAGFALERLLRRFTSPTTARFFSTAFTSSLAIAGKMLTNIAREIEEPLTEENIDNARQQLRALVGRDTNELDEIDVARAVIESVAENTVDAVVAPALWAAVFGSSGAAAYRAANTLDAMVGHRSRRYARFGWASARIDDVANWVPARCTAMLVMLVRPASARAILRTVRRDAPAHPSPNSGVAEAAFAAAIDVRLGGVNRYGDRTEDRGTLGNGRSADAKGIEASRALLRDVTSALAALLAVLSLWFVKDATVAK